MVRSRIVADPGADEAQRLAALRRYRILDTLPERAYDDIVRLASTLCGTPISTVTLIDAERQWFKASVGVEDRETSRDIAFCDHAIRQPEEMFVVDNASLDPRFADNPLVTGGPEIRFYAGMPLVDSDGAALGTVCVIDRKPRELTDEQRDGLRALARQVVALLELRRMNLDMQRLLAEREMLTTSLMSYQQELEGRNQALSMEANRDHLTGLMNRGGLDRLKGDARAGRVRFSGPYVVAVLDIDHFKRVNDGFGHAAGDEVLKAVAADIRNGIRGGDVAGRYGGEEFVVFLPDTSVEGAQSVIERIRLAVSGRDDLPTPVTLSAGLAAGVVGTHAVEDVFLRADQALYQAKRAGRNRVEISRD
ncbi:GGDEF domain-containing protein [Arenimonas sp. MALMAid1274]|uniref:GGDEF domain-containing protein n=1 Tax=Arenimonas sp. MALMAid1274 TaxID=3411630 RepID=UPI003BA367B6